MDLMVVQAEAEGGTLKVEQVREDEVPRTPAVSIPFKVVLFLRFQEANASAQNALLKTLEEAPAYALLLLTADNAEQLLPTIVSRCEVLRLRPTSTEAVTAFLTAQGVEAERARLLGHLSGGRPGYALRLAADEQTLTFRAERLEELRELLALPAARALPMPKLSPKTKKPSGGLCSCGFPSGAMCCCGLRAALRR